LPPSLILIFGFLSIILKILDIELEAVTILVKDELIDPEELAKELVYKITDASSPGLRLFWVNTRYPPNHKTLNVAEFVIKLFAPLYMPLDMLFLKPNSYKNYRIV
jgi:hypothetical protein